MILIEDTTVPDAALPVEALKRHLRFGTAYGPDAVQDAVLASFLRAALSAIEARTSKALIRRGFLLTLDAWRETGGEPMPIAPITALSDVTLIDRFGVPAPQDVARFRVSADAHAPRLLWQHDSLPRIPEGGTAEIRFVAGYADDAEGLPADLFQAVMLLAAHYYEYRDDTALSQGCMPFGVTSLVARYRRVRIGFTS